MSHAAAGRSYYNAVIVTENHLRFVTDRLIRIHV